MHALWRPYSRRSLGHSKDRNAIFRRPCRRACVDGRGRDATYRCTRRRSSRHGKSAEADAQPHARWATLVRMGRGHGTFATTTRQRSGPSLNAGTRKTSTCASRDVTPCIVNNIRSRKDLQHADFKDWLDDMLRLRREQAHLRADGPKFERYDENKHLRIPQSNPELGEVVHSIRSKRSSYTTPTSRTGSTRHGQIVYGRERAHPGARLWPKFKRWYDENKHLRIPKSNPELGNVVHNIRSQKIFLHHADFKDWLDATALSTTRTWLTPSSTCAQIQTLVR